MEPVVFVQFKTLDEEGIEGGIWKDKTRIGVTAEGHRWIVKIGTSEESDEVVSYQLAQQFFEGIVPETHLIVLENGSPASAQRMVSGAAAHDLEANGTLYEKVRDSGTLRDLANMVVLDFMIGNPDRHGNNWFIMNNGRIAAIDNGFAAEEVNMPINRALRPLYKCLLVDDCAHSPAIIGIMQGIVGRIDNKEYEANLLTLEYSSSPKHKLLGRWQNRVDQLKKGIDKWQKELTDHCHY